MGCRSFLSRRASRSDANNGRTHRPHQWPCLDSNQGATDYESAALPLSYRAAICADASTGHGARGLR